jgi:branched-subunit amino acid transport protein
MLPMVMFRRFNFSPFWRRFLRFIPYAALSALIFPGFLTSTRSPASALVGGLAAFALAWFRFNLMLVVLGGILGAILWQSLYN